MARDSLRPAPHQGPSAPQHGLSDDPVHGQDGGTVAERLAALAARIAAAAPDPARVTLVAVSKAQPVTKVEAAIAAGQRVFGENRVQEAAAKWPAIRQRHPHIALHMIGPLQTNKVREAVALFDVIETVDRPKLAGKLAQEMERSGRRLPCFVQVNTGEEPQKSGVLPDEADRLIRECRETFGLNVVGLMCMPPIDEEPALHFALLREIARRNGLTQLSMGMTADFEIALRFGATHIRVGTAVFGPRPPARGAPG
ncbi:MAG: YggS family pyridoxal phosphate-dependent enzyme [Kiloniellales bacterium]